MKKENTPFYYDCKRWGFTSRFQAWKYTLFVPQVKFVYFKRRCEFWSGRSRIMFLFYRLIYEIYMIRYNISLPTKVKIGRGFKIEHIGGIVINPGVVFGDNVNLYNGVTIGVTKRGAKKGIPVIGNKVWIGANAIIVGKVIVNDNVLIVPGAYVNFDVPPDSIVIGNPGKIIRSENATAEYIDNIV